MDPYPSKLSSIAYIVKEKFPSLHGAGRLLYCVNVNQTETGEVGRTALSQEESCMEVK